jgi:hypothetical protein
MQGHGAAPRIFQRPHGEREGAAREGRGCERQERQPENGNSYCPRSACLHRCCRGALRACNLPCDGRAMQRAVRPASAVLFCRRRLQPRCGGRGHVWRRRRRLLAAPLWCLAVTGWPGSCCLRCAGMAAGRGEASVCAARAQGGAAAVRCGPRFGVRCEGGGRAERRLVGWLVQRSRTGCCSLRPRRTGRKCRRAPVRAQRQRPARCAFGWMVWVAPPLGLGRSRRVREGRRGAGAAAVEGSS